MQAGDRNTRELRFIGTIGNIDGLLEINLLEP
jgi:hypothetical protein